MTILDRLASVWDGLLRVAGSYVIPDWSALVGLLPVFLLVLVIGPAVTLGVLAWVVYGIRRPRARVTVDEGPRTVPVAPDGLPEYPVGLPYCVRDGLVLASGATRCPACRDDLRVVCPMCGLGREAAVTTCGNCGLVLRVVSRARVLRPTGPPPGGAAIA